ncbi:MAG TPA: DUF3472 domain-containing protein [Fimbriimonas sp.]|nr:DUF3472 domain-containing protein [Fimbriimonas sp.]
MSTLKLLPAALWMLSPAAFGQHLIWKPANKNARFQCLYGDIQVVATNKTIYYCGCNWWPGKPAGGYTGIQDAGKGRHLMIFSIWDTSPKLHPKTVQTESRAKANRFGGEGEGAHTHLEYNWKVGERYQFFAIKSPDKTGAYTLTRVFFFDRGLKKWVKEATISSPNNGNVSVPTFGGMLNAFLENWSGEEKNKPKLALYQLWAGKHASDLREINTATGDGKWGVIGDQFFLAEGYDKALEPYFKKLKRRTGHGPIFGRKRGPSLRVGLALIRPKTIAQLEKLEKL